MQVFCSTDNKREPVEIYCGEHYHQKILAELTIFDISHVPSENICVRIRPLSITKWHLIDFRVIFQTLETKVQIKGEEFL